MKASLEEAKVILNNMVGFIKDQETSQPGSDAYAALVGLIKGMGDDYDFGSAAWEDMTLETRRGLLMYAGIGHTYVGILLKGQQEQAEGG